MPRIIGLWLLLR
uniref:Uncharacterized protein n=1 Tax=Anguilla anguilla TaxID=7936 RepID=A0A0E9W0L2_ANGAN